MRQHDGGYLRVFTADDLRDGLGLHPLERFDALANLTGRHPIEQHVGLLLAHSLGQYAPHEILRAGGDVGLGIGDADEVLKPLSGHRMLTNAPEYKAQLESLGYKVILLPAVANSYRTYVNSLIIKDTVFMPTYGISADQEATAVYQSLGYKVYGIPSNDLSDNMHGSVHCQSMAYPAMSQQALLDGVRIGTVIRQENHPSNI